MYIYSFATTEGIVKKINQDALLIKTAEYKGCDIINDAINRGCTTVWKWALLIPRCL